MLILAVSSAYVSAAVACSLNVSMINQDPAPAIPGDYVKLIFQVTGMENPECGDVSLKLNQNFPFTLDPGEPDTYSSKAGYYDRDYSSFFTVPFKVRVDNSALDGDNPIEVLVSSASSGLTGKTASLSKFQVDVKNKKTDFEVYVKDYVLTTNIMTLEVLNIGKNDIKALTVEIPKQEAITVKGANKNVLGDLDSNEYTTADFEVSSGSGAFDIIIYYTDTIGIRRTVNNEVLFDPTYFQNRKADQKSLSGTSWFFIILIIAGIVYFFYRRYKKNNHHKTA